MRCFLVTFVVLVLGFGGVGCAVSEQQELALGLENHGQFEKESGGRYGDAVVQGYVSSVGMPLAKLGGRPTMQWQFHVLASDQVNAFAVPGGYIYITKGLLFRMENEAQLAGVLGHEVAHIAMKHSAKSIETQQTTGLLTAGVSILAQQAGYAGAADAVQMASGLGLAKYSRNHETEADYYGLGYMAQLGYNPNGMVQVMKILKAASGGKSAGGLGAWTSTHPDPGDRVSYLTAAIKEKYAALGKSGKFGEAEFRAAVLSRQRAAGLAGSEAVVVSEAYLVEGATALVMSAAGGEGAGGTGHGGRPRLAHMAWCESCRVEAEKRARAAAEGRTGAGELLRNLQ